MGRQGLLTDADHMMIMGERLAGDSPEPVYTLFKVLWILDSGISSA